MWILMKEIMFFLENEDFLTLDVVNVVEFILQFGSQKHCFFVVIVPDNETEGYEQFTIQLTSSHPFLTFINNEATVTIEDDTTFSANPTPVTIEDDTTTCGGTQTAVTDREVTMNVTLVKGSTSAGIWGQLAYITITILSQRLFLLPWHMY